jgi:hypothetical protein
MEKMCFCKPPLLLGRVYVFSFQLLWTMEVSSAKLSGKERGDLTYCSHYRCVAALSVDGKHPYTVLKRGPALFFSCSPGSM